MVEDSEDDARLLCSELASAGNDLTYKQVDCVSGMRAALQESDWDVVISDHAMPSFSSLEALDLLKQSGKDIPFIIYSGNIGEQVAVSAMRNGAHDYVYKGNGARLIPSIERELKNAAIRRAQKQAETHIYRLAYHDELTGLPKRNLFCEKVGEVLSERSLSGAAAAMYFIDLDRLMRINNTYGYAMGDALIRQVAQRLKDCVGETGILARVGGDKFAVFKGSIADSREMQTFADHVMESFTVPFAIDNLEFDVTLSMGICVYPDDGEDVSTLLVNAESAMALAKKLWRNNYKYYVKEMGEASSRRLVLETSLRRAVERGELLVQYQPIVDVRTGNFTGAEALVRWNHPQFGLLAPDKFIPLADEIGLIIEIGEWVLHQACMQTKSWHDMGFYPLSISVNVSAVQLGQPQLLNQVAGVLTKTGLDPACLELEITESVLMQDAEATISMLRALKEMGIKISVDDFGTGFSSLSYLKRFPIDILKIDKSFTRDIDMDPDNSAIVTAIAVLARSLNLSVLAEGVESQQQLDFLRGQKCDRVQGYLFSRPLNPEVLLPLMAQKRAA
ncbi:MAG: GGDEF domain-containing response regulator [Betaproteobacteria bacterium]|nr:GGDEF domain-containing response regulator [Betaproteobacteria bacterium]